MCDPQKIEQIMATVSIPVMAKCRIGHFAEAQVLETLGVDYIDESEVLTPADEEFHVDKFAFKVPFVCGCRDLGEALRRVGEGAAMLRTKGEAGTGNIVEAVRHMRTVVTGIRRLTLLGSEELMTEAKRLGRRTRSCASSRARASCPCRTSPRRDRDTGRRGPDDAARRRGRVRGLGDLQVLGAGTHGRRDRPRHDALQGAGRGGRGLARPGSGHARSRDRGPARTELLQHRGW